MNDLVLRHEYKHHINYFDYLSIHSGLMAVAKRDTHAGEEGIYEIRSLYFDNYENKALQEKINGVCNREKFRIRYYNDDFDFIKLEKKSKIHGLCNKISTLISKEECEKIIQGDIDWLKDRKDALMVELYAKMRYQMIKPKTIVAYTREPFVYNAGNVRITFDYNVRTGISSKDFFNINVPTIAASENEEIILEVKYDHFLPEVIENIVQLGNRRTSSFSKYVACRTFG